MIRTIKLSDALKMTRNKPARFESTTEWRTLKTVLDKRALTPDEAKQIVLTPEEQQEYRITNRRTVARFIRAYIEDHKLPYTVTSFNRGNDFVIQVAFQPVRSRTA